MLDVLYSRIEDRVRRTLDQHPNWPCRKGCDECCRSLSHPPLLTQAEWDRVGSALLALEPGVRREVETRIRNGPDRVCPLLDRGGSGACLVYADRPAACRTYGFYADREGGLYCHTIENRVQSGELDTVVWGNHEAVDQSLDKLGERRSLAEWLGTVLQRLPY